MKWKITNVLNHQPDDNWGYPYDLGHLHGEFGDKIAKLPRHNPDLGWETSERSITIAWFRWCNKIWMNWFKTPWHTIKIRKQYGTNTENIWKHLYIYILVYIIYHHEKHHDFYPDTKWSVDFPPFPFPAWGIPRNDLPVSSDQRIGPGA